MNFINNKREKMSKNIKIFKILIFLCLSKFSFLLSKTNETGWNCKRCVESSSKWNCQTCKDKNSSYTIQASQLGKINCKTCTKNPKTKKWQCGDCLKVIY